MSKQFNINFKTVISAVLLTASLIVLVMMLFNPQPIQIVLETGQEIVTQSPDYFGIGSVMLLIVCSFAIGVTITYIFYNANASNEISNGNGSAHHPQSHTHSQSHTLQYSHKEHEAGTGNHGAYELIMPLLREDEKKAVRIIRENNGEILQNDLVLKLGLSKVKTTRILASLERKQVVIKHRHGLTNHVRLTHK